MKVKEYLRRVGYDIPYSIGMICRDEQLKNYLAVAVAKMGNTVEQFVHRTLFQYKIKEVFYLGARHNSLIIDVKCVVIRESIIDADPVAKKIKCVTDNLIIGSENIAYECSCEAMHQSIDELHAYLKLNENVGCPRIKIGVIPSNSGESHNFTIIKKKGDK